MTLYEHERDRIILRLRGAGCVYAEDEADLLLGAGTSGEALETMIDRRVNGEPLEYVLGWAEFCSIRVRIAPGVFVPRVRTELLVREAVAALSGRTAAVVVDLCCGSGAIGAAIAADVGGIRLYAADVDPVAVECARQNLAGFGGFVYQGDLFAALPVELRGRVNVLVANVPYVPTDAIRLMPTEARLFEPFAALDGGPDGLSIFRRVAAEAPDWLAPDARLLSEVSEQQAPIAEAIMRDAGLIPRLAYDDDLEATVVMGVKPRSG